MKSELEGIPEMSPGETRTAYKWLRTFDDLAIYDHRRAESDTVWFVTSDVFKYALSVGVREKIEATLDKVRYRYLIPEPDGTNERAAREQLENLKRFRPDRIDYRCFKREVFEKQATSDYVIVETSAADGGGVKAFVRIPIAETEEQYWFETEENAGAGFYHRFLQLWNSSDSVAASMEERARAALQSGEGLGA